ncbi:membrane protein insertion efficiency factor YidD [Variovorax sp. PCZ-1]|uniref:membrane protein insertion efficiency factor YidD n=1 Tax=Variovorax sp. PCZ-1 TaxID=2835533 RepID=UPI001BCD616B|nr:membrane protein insertion efficiency factor YidD [Variovorax sp. PCZ-1]MBS7808749.1 membrane protein insertion efficiency factor YidD [Variovorax sp. PCZ-1]
MSVLQKILIGIVQFYRLFLSAWLGSACRFTPTCSAYALEALQQHGAGRGSYLAARRIVRCHPWCEGGHDPVPPANKPVGKTANTLFTSLVSPEKTSS